jgi:SAM-dependent methyltransferase
MTTDTAVTPDLYFDTIWAYQRSAALKSAIDLELFTKIGEGASTAHDIATACGASERGTRILCDFLTTLEFLAKSGDLYSLTPVSAAFLNRRSPAYLGATADFLYSSHLIQELAPLTDTIRSGAAPGGGLEPEHPMWVSFARAMVPMAMPTAQAVADALTLSNTPMRVLDIAAGHGMYGVVVGQRNPSADVVGVDWDNVLTVARENAAAMGVGDRYRTIPGDAFTVDYGSGYDLVLLPNFLHHFDRARNVALLRKIAAALNPGGRVAIVEFVPHADRVSPPMAARFAFAMLANTPAGDVYTAGDLDAMLRESGFTSVTVQPLQGPQTLVVGTK